MFILIARNGTKAFSDVFCKFFLPTFNINRLCLKLPGEECAAPFFISFFNENFKFNLETVDSSIGFQKKIGERHN